MAKMKKCKFCGAVIVSNSNYCPQCGRKNKKSFISKWWFWAITVVVVIFLYSIGGNSSAEANKVEGSSQMTNLAKTDESQKTPGSSGTEESNREKSVPVPEISNQLLYEGNDVTITATEIKKSGSGWAINLLIENHSNLNLGFNAHAYAINGIMTRNNIYAMDCDVAAGKKANVSLDLKGDVLKEYGISEVRCVDVLFWAYDNDKYYKEFDTEQIEIKTSLYDGSHDIIQGTNIFDSDGIKIDYLKRVGNSFSFVITNDRGSLFAFDFDELSINDYSNSETDYDLFDEMLLNDCQIVVTVNVSKEFLSNNGITEIESIEWNLSVRPDGSYFDEFKVGPIVYNIELG